MSNEKKNLISLSELDQLTHRCLTIMSLMDRLAGCVQNGAPEDDDPGKDNDMQHAARMARELMGSVRKIKLASLMYERTLICVSGMQGAGKTTHAAKLAHYFKKMDRRPLLVACDIYRPAAVEQLKIVGAAADVPVFTLDGEKPVRIATEAVRHAKTYGNDIVILDTAGRLHIDEPLMEELRQIKKAVSPDEILLVVDAMTGQDAVNVAESFDAQLDIDKREK